MTLEDFERMMLHNPDNRISLKDMIYAYYFQLFGDEHKATVFADIYIVQLRKDMLN